MANKDQVEIVVKRGTFTVSRASAREAKQREAQPSRTLPSAWYEPGTAERMAEWIKRWIKANGLV